jgi:hypothetical protein
MNVSWSAPWIVEQTTTAEKRKRRGTLREARANKHLDGTAAGEALKKARMEIFLERGKQ